MNRALSPLLLSSLLSLGCAGVTAKAGGAGAAGEPGGNGGPVGGGSGTGVIPNGSGAMAGGSAIGAVGCSHELRAAVRDFRGMEENGQPRHPDFEQPPVMDDRGMVANTLGPDSKPVYAGGPNGTPTTTGQADFDQWYRDVTGVNVHVDVSIPLTADPTRAGVYVYDNDQFFPIDKMGWMDQTSTSDHNHDFTLETHFSFPYRGGEVFNFRGDDDVWVFINAHLAIDLGGIHPSEMGMVDLDARAAELGLAVGGTYQMDVFYADRHCCGSTFHVETTLQCITNIEIN